MLRLALYPILVAVACSLVEPLWQPLPHVDRREVLFSTSIVVASSSPVFPWNKAAGDDTRSRSVASIDSHLAIPVWPTWGGGRVVPVSTLQDPFLLLAHHKHWFDPRDPLRGPFKAVGKALGLPYVDVEGFALHPHRGMDILTYVLDGSDGFRHRDSLNKTSRVYRGGCAQWMRTGSGVMHEEFWETRPDRRTNIELFQLWINLPACQKMEVPVIRYIGATTEDRWLEHCPGKGVRVRDLGATLEASLERLDSGDGNRPSVRRRPPVTMQHVTMGPGTEWMAPVPSDHSAMVYVREGTATLSPAEKVKALQTATFQPDGNSVRVRNTDRAPLDLLLLTGKPLREPVAWRGPIVMNKEQELNDAFRQLQSGTFLDRNVVLREHKATLRHPG